MSNRIVYWAATAPVLFALGAGGVGDVLRIPSVVEGMTRLGYPEYFCVILGVWKVLGALALAAPGWPRLKEWAYAGALFDFSGAVVSHLAVGDPMGKAMAPLVFAVLTMASWALRRVPMEEQKCSV